MELMGTKDRFGFIANTPACKNLELRTRGPNGAALARSRTARQIDLSGRVVVFESLKKGGR